MHQLTTHQSTPSVLASLRAVIPTHDQVTFAEALRVAELQANKLLERHRVTEAPVPRELITELPKLTIRYGARLVSGASYWDKHLQSWVIELSRADSWQRRRFTLAHEYKHIIDHGRQQWLYRGTRRTSAAVQAEHAADYFAGCLLVPRRLLKRAWGSGMQRTADLARHFQVSEQAIGVRLRQCGLVDEVARHATVGKVW
ncbi:ImmA/IrrE family metallo-endopeptidase [Mycolicibacterium grossiae]|uniref:Zn peptidase n=1 Tax=Mycolicibacterium grossiae TaxID=1552759 RepID=A0A1E8QB36_9MYCO|nr:ImmA/IrrE family metallo-endopeptidase [Mycolicibacterium grossiae]OFJ55646.1 Zn peptidase [Mycolicibacterium grossiae]QEM43520.1 ImmA/IrrE family metallo-endopeptidase [Mycolicibacterium grossiae]